MATAAAAQSGAAPPVTAPPLKLAPAITLSDDRTPDFDRAAKSRLVRLANGTLVAVYCDAVADDPDNYVYDLKADVERPARDIFVRTCDSAGADCADPRSWTDSVNISNTAALSSIDTDWTGDTDDSAERTPFHGDSGKPNIFGSGDRVVITWVDAYCPGEGGSPTAQRTVTYLERNDREVPFRCVYAAHAQARVDTIALGNWTVKRLSDGSRDAHQDVNRGMQNGGWAVIWQEDPRGLQPGEAEGPGDGASGARVSLGTDVWYTYSGPGGAFGAWQTPVRLTDNWTARAGKPGGGPGGGGNGSGGGGGGGGEHFGNNLSNPAIWSDGVAKDLRGIFGDPVFDGELLTVADVDWYLQQDQHNEWQAETLDAMAAGITPFSVDQIDWGDNLEARDWPASSQVRVETVLYSAPADAMTGFEMGYLFGEGSTEMWGASGFTYRTDAADAASDPRKSAIATVYSRCARLTIQKLIGTRENPGLLAWDPQLGQWTGDVEEPDFNRGVWEAGEGPGGYSAEINVRGRLIYGYNWRVAQLHPVDTAGDYRLTFSVDGLGPDPTPAHCDVALNTDLSAATLLPGGGEGRGAVPAIDALNNLTYIDVRILPGDGGSSGGGSVAAVPGAAGEAAPGRRVRTAARAALPGKPGDVHDGGEEEEQNPIREAAGNLVARGDIETGSAGASRPNLGLVSNTAIVAYEETKGAGGGQGGGGPDSETAGKFVRYHQFPFQSPPARSGRLRRQQPGGERSSRATGDPGPGRREWSALGDLLAPGHRRSGGVGGHRAAPWERKLSSHRPVAGGGSRLRDLGLRGGGLARQRRPAQREQQHANRHGREPGGCHGCQQRGECARPPGPAARRRPLCGLHLHRERRPGPVGAPAGELQFLDAPLGGGCRERDLDGAQEPVRHQKLERRCQGAAPDGHAGQWVELPRRPPGPRGLPRHQRLLRGLGDRAKGPGHR